MSSIDVNYSDRPNKSLVRSRIFHIIEQAFHPEHKHSEKLSFITLSGYRFIDSIEFYHRFNIRNIYSIECKPKRWQRARFNKPYEFIVITKGTIKDFIDEKYASVVETRKVIFLDYESRLIDDVLSDLDALFSSGFFKKKSLLFITFNRAFDRDKLTPKVKDILDDRIRTPEAFKTWLSEEFSNIVLNKLQRKYGSSKKLTEVLKVFYCDTSNMVVFGYLIADRRRGDVIRTIKTETFTLPELTFLEANYIHNNLRLKPMDIANNLGLNVEDVRSYIQYS